VKELPERVAAEASGTTGGGGQRNDMNSDDSSDEFPDWAFWGGSVYQKSL